VISLEKSEKNKQSYYEQHATLTSNGCASAKEIIGVFEFVLSGRFGCGCTARPELSLSLFSGERESTEGDALGNDLVATKLFRGESETKGEADTRVEADTRGEDGKGRGTASDELRGFSFIMCFIFNTKNTKKVKKLR
jgi:hypothetical protein